MHYVLPPYALPLSRGMISLIKFLPYTIIALIVSGALGASEVHAVPPRTEKSQTALFNTYDRNKDGKITLQEFLHLNDCRTQSCRDYLTKTFRKMDLIGDGAITLEEYLAPVRRKGKN